MNWSNEWGKPSFIDENETVHELFNGKYQITTIKLGNKTISVIVVGDLGLDFDADGWNIYHLPSGACFDGAVPGYRDNWADDWQPVFDYDKQSLLNWMAKVQTNYPTSWIILRQLTRETYENSGKTAKEIIQKWCLSVKVE